ncbi:MAG TPA: CHAT domain-containing protein [Gemmatimonadaceae bacterium]|nr:CHAT domain-containing protein [Gemmatimonadaceae bacterium]
MRTARFVVLAAGVAGIALAQSGVAPIGVDAIITLTRDNDARLRPAVRAAPDSARVALARILESAARTVSPDAYIASAQRLGAAYAHAWADSFFVREVQRFSVWPPSSRQTKIRLDSLRIAGADLLASAGPGAAMRAWRESERLARTIQDSAGQGAALGNIGVAHYRAGALDSAEHCLVASRAIAERVGDRRTALNALGTLATIAKDRQEFSRARTLYEQTLARRAAIGDDRGAASDENNLGLIAQELGDTAQARTLFERALKRNRDAARVSVASDNIANLAGLAVLRGEYERAVAGYRTALSIRHEAGERAREASILQDLGRLELRRGRLDDARAALSEAIRIFDASGQPVDAVLARTDLAMAEGAMGNLQSAVSALRAADSIASRDSQPDLLAGIALMRGDLAVEFNASADAERSYRDAARRFRAAGDSGAAVDADQGLALLYLGNRNAAAARPLLASVLSARRASGDRHAAALAQCLSALAIAETGDTARGVRELRQAADLLHRLADSSAEANAIAELAGIEMRAGRAATAEQLYDRAIALARGTARRAVRAELLAGRARVRSARGNIVGTANDLRAAIDISEALAGVLWLPERRAGFRADKWTLYQDLALAELRRGDSSAAFAISEQLRGREMLELLDAGHVSVAHPASALARREQELRRRIVTLERTLQVESGPERVRGFAFRADASGASAEALEAAQREYSEVLVQLHESAPAYGQLVQPQTLDVRAVQARLAADEALLEYLVTDSTAVVFVVRHSSVRAVDLHISRRNLAAAVDFSRSVIDGTAVAASSVAWRAPLQRLYGILIDPVERSGGLQGARTLFIAPHAELHYLPFAALMVPGAGARYLVERFNVAYVPSASVWARLSARRGTASGGDVVGLAPRTDKLPASRDEVNALRTLYGARAKVFTGRAATRTVLARQASSANVIHLATFGVLNKHNPLFSFVELAPDGADDGRLAVHDVFGMQLRAQLVVLSACQTALGSGPLADVPAGDEWVGLSRAFLFAGAHNVMATLWPVQDRAAATLMRTFYEELANNPPLLALSRAQRRAIRDSRPADPPRWAAYTLITGGVN